jgi:hypothetical protein
LIVLGENPRDGHLIREGYVTSLTAHAANLVDTERRKYERDILTPLRTAVNTAGADVARLQALVIDAEANLGRVRAHLETANKQHAAAVAALAAAHK